jgi:hypothetical protein
MDTSRSIATLLLSLSVSACASTPPGRTGQETVRISGQQGTGLIAPVTTTSEAVVRTVSAPAARVWSLMPAVYDSLGIELGRHDPGQRVIGNESLSIRRQLRGVPLRRYLDCGQTQIDANADSYLINLSILSELRPSAGGTTEVATMVEARGRSIQFAGNWVRCRTTGALEARIIDVLSTLLQN